MLLRTFGNNAQFGSSVHKKPLKIFAAEINKLHEMSEHFDLNLIHKKDERAIQFESFMS